MDERIIKLLRAIHQLGPTKLQQAARIGKTPKQLKRWEGGAVPEVILDLESAGVIAILDPDAHTPTCNCQADRAA